MKRKLSAIKDSAMAYSEQVKGFDEFARSGYTHIISNIASGLHIQFSGESYLCKGGEQGHLPLKGIHFS